MDEWRDEEEIKSPNIIDDISDIFNFRTFLFLEDNSLKTNKRLGKISYIRNKQVYRAEHSIHFPKIIYKKKIYNNLKDWIAFVRNPKHV
jgi:hypothetical protein